MFDSSRLQNNEISENISCRNIDKDQAGWVVWWVCGGGVGSFSKSNSCHNEFPTGMNFPYSKGLELHCITGLVQWSTFVFQLLSQIFFIYETTPDSCSSVPGI